MSSREVLSEHAVEEPGEVAGKRGDPTQQSATVMGFHIDVVNEASALEQMLIWAKELKSRSVFFCNVHSVVTARSDTEFAGAMDRADFCLPDGAPIAWWLRREGYGQQRRISGPDLMWQYLDACQAAGHVVSFFGSTEETLEKLRTAILNGFPRLKIGTMISPPFRPLTADDNAGFARQINEAGTRALLVGLGCPKQEVWIDSQRDSIQAVMLGVGAAFSFHAGMTARAPHWMRRNGLEWLHRLYSEPRRLASRYLTTNSVFVAAAVRSFVFQSRVKDRIRQRDAGRSNSD